MPKLKPKAVPIEKKRRCSEKRGFAFSLWRVLPTVNLATRWLGALSALEHFHVGQASLFLS